MALMFRSVLQNDGGAAELIVTCDSEFAGATISCSDGTTTLNKTCPSSSPYEVTFKIPNSGDWTISATVSGTAYTSDPISVELDYTALLEYGFNWRRWVDTAQYLDSSDYNSLEEVLADELAVRELCLEHACVDYLAAVPLVNTDIETIINNDLFAKWVNNSDYSLDVLGANVAIKALMDTADKYGYGEWALVGQVPKMTSNSAPYGEAIASGEAASGYAAWKAFDNVAVGTTDYWGVNTSTGWLGYHFVNPVIIKRFTIRTGLNTTTATYGVKTFKIEASNDGFVNDVHELSDVFTFDNAASEITADIQNDTAYLYYRVNCLSGFVYQGEEVCYIAKLQFYAWQPKGNVPVMTSNTAPYGEASFSGGTVSNPAYVAFNGDRTNSCTASGAQSLTYKFTNPVNVKRIKWIPYQADGSQTFKAHTVTFYGSNDNSTWTTLGSKEVAVTDKTNELTLDIPNNTDYFLYYKVTPDQANAGNHTVFCSLQYYGRELSVSVPKMTSNTAPYGEAFGNPVPTSSGAYNYNPWASFNKVVNDLENGWYGTSSGAYVGYDFANDKVMAKMAVITSLSTTRAFTFKIQGSNTGNNDDWHDVSDVISKTTSLTVIPIVLNSLVPYSKYRCVIQDVYNTYANINDFSIFGEDYSEKEFEEGTTKKWLYDHGVELETMVAKTQNNGVATKNPSDLFVSVPASQSQMGTFYCQNVDLSPFNLIRAKNGDKAYQGNASYVTHQIAVYNVEPTYSTTPVGVNGLKMGDSMLPNNIFLDVSSYNANYYVTVICANNSGTTNHYGNIKELWLE